VSALALACVLPCLVACTVGPGSRGSSGSLHTAPLPTGASDGFGRIREVLGFLVAVGPLHVDRRSRGSARPPEIR